MAVTSRVLRAWCFAVAVVAAASESTAEPLDAPTEAVLRETMLSEEEQVEAIHPAAWSSMFVPNSPDDPPIATGWLVLTSARWVLARWWDTHRAYRPSVIVPWSDVRCAALERYGAWTQHPHLAVQLDLLGIRVAVPNAESPDPLLMSALAAAIQRRITADRPNRCVTPAPIVAHEESGLGVPDRVGALERLSVASTDTDVYAEFLASGGERGEVRIDRKRPVSDAADAAVRRLVEEIDEWIARDSARTAKPASREVHFLGGPQTGWATALETRLGAEGAHVSIVVVDHGDWTVGGVAFARTRLSAEESAAALVAAVVRVAEPPSPTPPSP